MSFGPVNQPELKIDSENGAISIELAHDRKSFYYFSI